MSTVVKSIHPTARETWPSLPYEAWKDTYATLHMWTQIVGKIRMRLTPAQNHWWHVPLYVTARGLSTSLIPGGSCPFEIEFDFIDHRLQVRTAGHQWAQLPLRSGRIAAFYADLMKMLRSLGIEIGIWTLPQEVEPAIPFEEDERHAAYDPDFAHRFCQVLGNSDRLLRHFCSSFQGKCSPVHFFWGSFDLAVTRFSGRPAPEHAGGVPGLADWVVREAYSHEVSSAGWWPGGPAFPQPAFYAYAYPQPDGYRNATVEPEAAFYHESLGEYILPYELMRRSADPGGMLMRFLESTYAAAAESGFWPRAALERDPLVRGAR